MDQHIAHLQVSHLAHAPFFLDVGLLLQTAVAVLSSRLVVLVLLSLFQRWGRLRRRHARVVRRDVRGASHSVDIVGVHGGAAGKLCRGKEAASDFLAVLLKNGQLGTIQIVVVRLRDSVVDVEACEVRSAPDACGSGRALAAAHGLQLLPYLANSPLSSYSTTGFHV